MNKGEKEGQWGASNPEQKGPENAKVLRASDTKV
jgi:hypothetical protein